MAARNGMERWRGEVTATLSAIGDGITEIKTALTKHTEQDTANFDAMATRLNNLEPKVATVGARLGITVGLIAAVCSGATTYLLHRLTNG